MGTPLEDHESHILKHEFIEAYKNNGGFAYAAAKQIGIRYKTAHYWMETDPDFKDLYKEVKGNKLDRAEAELYQRAIRSTDKDACLIFYLKTIGRERGYIEKMAEDNDTKQTLTVEFKANESDAQLSESLKEKIIQDYLEKQKMISQ